MNRRTVLGRIWDRQQDRTVSDVEMSVRGEFHELSLREVRNATDARGEGVQTLVRGESNEQSLREVRNAADARGESIRGGGAETRQRGETAR